MKNTQVLIVGGGLAGLTTAMHLCQNGIKVTLIEKDEFPHHKVCGEYLSNEIIPYFKSLKVSLDQLTSCRITRLAYSSVTGKLTASSLDMGGLGISRYTLDHHLLKKAEQAGCDIHFDTVNNIVFKNGQFVTSTSEGKEFISEFVIGAYGKRSNLDKKLEREFINKSSGWLAVKAHYENEVYPDDLVSLHNFKGGYCGLSRTDLNSVNVCYLASYKSFKNYKNTQEYRERVLMQNPNLNEFFKNSSCLFEKELSIAQVNFDRKSLIKNHVLMIGDSAGLIHPLCGNGMAMAIHSAKILSENLLNFYNNKYLIRSDLENEYTRQWNIHFRSRLHAGIILQKVLLNQSASKISQNMVARIPGILPHIIKRTHGKPLYV